MPENYDPKLLIFKIYSLVNLLKPRVLNIPEVLFLTFRFSFIAREKGIKIFKKINVGAVNAYIFSFKSNNNGE